MKLLVLVLFYLSDSPAMATEQVISGTAAASMSSQGLTFGLGLLALVVGALVNAWLNRLRDDRLRAEEAKAVAAALYGEILLLRKEVAQAANIVGTAHLQDGVRKTSLKFDQYLLERITLADPVLYRALASKLGMLAPDFVLAITKFHADYQEVRIWLPRLVENEERGFSYTVLQVLTPADNAVVDIKPALREIERMLKISNPAEDPPMIAARQAIAEQEQFFADMREMQQSNPPVVI